MSEIERLIGEARAEVARRGGSEDWIARGMLRSMADELEQAAAVAACLVTIADESFGLGPVETVDATLTRLQRGIFEQRCRIHELEKLQAEYVRLAEHATELELQLKAGRDESYRAIGELDARRDAERDCLTANARRWQTDCETAEREVVRLSEENDRLRARAASGTST